MTYWWVSQNKTFAHEHEGGYLWAPKRDARGTRPHHWATMESVRPGDVILSFVKQKICAIGVATSNAYDSSKPVEFGSDGDWTEDGHRVDVRYEKIQPQLFIPDVIEDLLKLLPKRYSPLTTTGGGSQGYLFNIPPIAARFLMNRIGSNDQAVERAIGASNLDRTVREALVQCRVGQGLFRENLVNYWNGTCAVTDVRLILRASHIKPWKDSNNQERLDCFNGLLLSPTYDALFDEGLVTFDEYGVSLQSPLLTKAEATALEVRLPVQLKRIEDRHLNYLKYHREVVFESSAVRRKR